MKKLEWAIKRSISTFNPYWLGLVGLLVATFGLWSLHVRPLQEQIADQQQVMELPPPVIVKTLQGHAFEQQMLELRRFDAMFPSFDRLTLQLELLFDILANHGLSIDKGQYILREKPGNSYRRFEARFPLHGSYLALRRALIDVQKELPNVAIADIQLTRPDVTSSQVEAQMHFVVFIRSSS